MRRRLFAISAAVSAVLCLATCALRARSYDVRDRVWRRSERGDRERYWSVSSDGGVIVAFRCTTRKTPEGRSARERLFLHPTAVEPKEAHVGTLATWTRGPRAEEGPAFGWAAREGPDAFGGDARSWELSLPHTAAAGVAAGLPALYVASVAIRQLRRRQRPDGCPRCGYDLTGNESGVCPECGSPAVSGVA